MSLAIEYLAIFIGVIGVLMLVRGADWCWGICRLAVEGGFEPYLFEQESRDRFGSRLGLACLCVIAIGLAYLAGPLAHFVALAAVAVLMVRRWLSSFHSLMPALASLGLSALLPVAVIASDLIK